jgi:hypothetical protein
MTDPPTAAQSLGLTQREIFRRIEKGELHFFETERGEVFICPHPVNPTQIGDK